MINFTIKTLDSNNHQFSVEDEITVEQLKQKVHEQMGIEPGLQRLIFCGRVLQDEKRLAEYDVQGKVVHLVQRAPPSPETRQGAPSAPNTSGGTAEGQNGSSNMQQQIRRLMSLNGPSDSGVDQQALLPTIGRLEFIRRMIAEIKASLASLRAHVEGEENRSSPASGENPTEQMETEPTPTTQPEEPEPLLDENGDETTPDGRPRAHIPGRRSYRAIRALRYTRPRDLAQLLEELETLQEQFAPYRANYIRMLQAVHNPEPPVFTEEERISAQRTVDMVSDIMHSFAHAYHAVSDINFQVGQRSRNPRITSESSIVRHPIPMQAHINVVQSNRRSPQQQQPQQQQGQQPQQQPQQPQQQPPQPTQPPPAPPQPQPQPQTQPQPQPQAQQRANTATTGNANARASATQTSANTTGSNTTTQGTRHASATAGRTTQPTVNINIQPDPITYQVEIETRVPIAFPLENALLNGLTNAAAVMNSAQEQQGQGQAGQANRRQVLLDFENLFRGLSQTGSLGGVEVVMSMEEIPHGGAVGVGHIVTGNNNNAGGGNATTGQQQQQQPVTVTDGGVYVAPMPWGGPPSADLLQNIVSSVIRQGLVPGVEGVTLQIPTQIGSQGGAQTGQAQGQQGSQTAQGQNTQNAQPNLHLRRATTTTRAQAVTLPNLTRLDYDRFLQCDSQHARRRIQRRREQQQQQIVAQERARAERIAAQHIEYLMQRNHHINIDHMTIITSLLSNAPSQESWFTAFLLTVARHLFLSEPLQSLNCEPVLIPHEFMQLRLLLRNYIQNLTVRASAENNDSSVQSVTDFFVNAFRDFIEEMPNITPLREEFDPYTSIRSLFRARLPALIGAVMSDSMDEMLVARFYAIFSRLYTDFCTLISHLCVEGLEGLRILYRRFLELRIRYFDMSIQGMVLVIANENLNAIINTLGSHCAHIQQHLHRRPGAAQSPPTDEDAEEPTPMEVSPPAASVRDEPMNNSSATTIQSNETQSSGSSVQEDTATMATTSTTSQSDAPNATTPTTPARVMSPKERSEPATPTRNANDQNIRFVPPLTILQHWGEEWVPVFTRDQERQRPEPQEPYSDAYISGMPSRKRRCLRQSRPPTTLNAFMDESVRDVANDRPAIAQAQAPDTAPMRVAFREYMRNLVRERAANSDDYDPSRFASAARFIHATRTNNLPKPQENGNAEPKEEE